MNKHIRLFLHLACFFVPMLLAGCEGEWAVISPAYALFADSDEEDGPAPVGVDIGGRWAGVYRNEDSGARMDITAKVGQRGDAVSITTSKEGSGQQLTGTIYVSENGGVHIVLTDALDGQTWTSQGQPSSTHLVVADYTHSPELGEPEPGLKVIDLSR
jgi:hypothetical protein